MSQILARRLQHFRRLARLMDEAVPIPGTGFRIGLDGIIGLIPGLGDLAGGIISAYGFVVGVSIGAPPAILLRMLLNIGIDTLVGMVPLLGDVFDFAWKANTRNRKLLEQFLANPANARRASRWVLSGVVGGMLALLGLAAWAGVWLLGEVWSLVASH